MQNVESDQPERSYSERVLELGDRPILQRSAVVRR